MTIGSRTMLLAIYMATASNEAKELIAKMLDDNPLNNGHKYKAIDALKKKFNEYKKDYEEIVETIANKDTVVYSEDKTDAFSFGKIEYGYQKSGPKLSLIGRVELEYLDTKTQFESLLYKARFNSRALDGTPIDSDSSLRHAITLLQQILPKGIATSAAGIGARILQLAMSPKLFGDYFYSVKKPKSTRILKLLPSPLVTSTTRNNSLQYWTQPGVNLQSSTYHVEAYDSVWDNWENYDELLIWAFAQGWPQQYNLTIHNMFINGFDEVTFYFNPDETIVVEIIDKKNNIRMRGGNAVEFYKFDDNTQIAEDEIADAWKRRAFPAANIKKKFNEVEYDSFSSMHGKCARVFRDWHVTWQGTGIVTTAWFMAMFSVSALHEHGQQHVKTNAFGINTDAMTIRTGNISPLVQWAAGRGMILKEESKEQIREPMDNRDIGEIIGTLMIGFALINDRNVIKAMPTSQAVIVNGYYRSDNFEVKTADESMFDRLLLKLSNMFTGLGFDLIRIRGINNMEVSGQLDEFTSINRVPVYYWKYIFGSDYSTDREAPSIGKPVVVRDETSLSFNNRLVVYMNDYIGIGKLAYLSAGNINGEQQPPVYVRGKNTWDEVSVSMWMKFNGGNELHSLCVIPCFSNADKSPMDVVFDYNPTLSPMILTTFGSVMEPRDDSVQKKWMSRSKAEVDSIYLDSLNL